LIAPAIEPLIQMLSDRDASMRVLAIYASRLPRLFTPPSLSCNRRRRIHSPMGGCV